MEDPYLWDMLNNPTLQMRGNDDLEHNCTDFLEGSLDHIEDTVRLPTVEIPSPSNEEGNKLPVVHEGETSSHAFILTHFLT
jgi:hypothetical protein